jgi:hypothetical protein
MLPRSWSSRDLHLLYHFSVPSTPLPPWRHQPQSTARQHRINKCMLTGSTDYLPGAFAALCSLPACSADVRTSTRITRTGELSCCASVRNAGHTLPFASSSRYCKHLERGDGGKCPVGYTHRHCSVRSTSAAWSWVAHNSHPQTPAQAPILTLGIHSLLAQPTILSHTGTRCNGKRGNQGIGMLLSATPFRQPWSHARASRGSAPSSGGIWDVSIACRSLDTESLNVDPDCRSLRVSAADSCGSNFYSHEPRALTGRG